MEDNIEYDPIELVGMTEYPTHYTVIWSSNKSYPMLYMSPNEEDAMEQYKCWIRDMNTGQDNGDRITMHRVVPGPTGRRKPKAPNLRAQAMATETWSGKVEPEEVPAIAEVKTEDGDKVYLTSVDMKDLKLTVSANTTKW